MIYAYKAVDEMGFIVKGILQTSNETSLKIALEQQKFQLIQAKLARRYPKFRRSSSLKLPLLEEFCLQMATFDRAGLTILQSLELLRDATENNLLKQSLIQTIHFFQSGMSLSKSFASVPRTFNAIFCSMIEAGEQTGELAVTFDQLAQLFNWQYGLKKSDLEISTISAYSLRSCIWSYWVDVHVDDSSDGRFFSKFTKRVAFFNPIFDLDFATFGFNC